MDINGATITSLTGVTSARLAALGIDSCSSAVAIVHGLIEAAVLGQVNVLAVNL